MGLIWVVQRVIYPMMAVWPLERFTQIHADYTRRVGSVVGPLMLIELAGALWWLVVAPSSALAWAAGVLMAVNWLSTGLLQVPLHQRLGRNFEPLVLKELIRTNWIRTVAWTARGLLLAGTIVI